MESPKHLKHQPILSVNDYSQIDGQYHADTDAEALSIGRAQWNEDDFSAKVWRYDSNNDKWSRQSEELPLHRVIDLTILTIASLITDVETHYPESILKEVVDEPEGVKQLQKFYQKNKKLFKPRLAELKRLLDSLETKEKNKY